MSTDHKAPRYVVFPNPLLPSPSQAQIFFSTLFLNTVSLHSSLNVRDEISRPYNTTGKITVLCSLIFIFLNNELKKKGSVLNDSKNIIQQQEQQ
jgi:hypothetical protein